MATTTSCPPRYYDYRAPRAFYIDEAPVAYRLHGYPGQPYGGSGPPPYPAAVIINPAPVYAPPMYAPSAYAPPVKAYAPPVQGYPVAPVVPNVVVRPQPICGVYRFWREDRCIDARGY
jgi:hypothetical protein